MKTQKNKKKWGRKGFYNLSLLTAATLMVTACGKKNTVTDGSTLPAGGAYYNGMTYTQVIDQILASPDMRCMNNYNIYNQYNNYNQYNPYNNYQTAYATNSHGRITYVYRGTLQREGSGRMSGTLSGSQGIGTMYVGGSSYIGKNSAHDLISYTESGNGQVEIVLYMCSDILQYGVNLQQINVRNLSPARSLSCYINEINGGTIELPSQSGVLPLAFYPIDADSSSLNGICNMSY